jgi:hypothetical protein
VLGLGQPGADLLRRLVRARADDRVVRRRLHDLAPGEREERRFQRRVVAAPAGEETLGVVDGPFGDGHGPLELRAHRQHAGQNVSAHVAAQLTADGLGHLVAGVRGDVLLDGGDVYAAAGALGRTQPRSEARVGRGVVGADHGEHRVGAPAVGRHPRVVGQRPVDHRGHQDHVEAVVVAVEEELGADRRAVGRFPAERVTGDGARHTAPEGGVLDAGSAQDLRHLRDVAEHVGQIAQRHGTAQRGRVRPAELEISDDRLAGAEELVEQDVPGAEREPARLGELAHLLAPLGPDLQVVEDRRRLTVHGELERALVFCGGQDHVERLHEAVAEDLERLVPLTVPVEMWDEDGVVLHRGRCPFLVGREVTGA